MDHTIANVQTAVFIFSLVLLLVFFVSLISMLIKKAYYRNLFNILPFLMFAGIASSFIMISLFAFLLVSILYLVVVSLGYARLRSGKGKILNDEKNGMIYLSFKEESRYDNKARYLTEEERDVWYKEFCNKHKIVSPVIIVTATITFVIAICVLIITANDYKGLFAIFEAIN